MTPFTDDDLKQLRLFLKYDLGVYLKNSVETLLIRLEAAENLIDPDAHLYCDDSCAHKFEYDKWRKAAGK